MEFFSILLAGLFSSLSPFGWIVDQRVEAAFRSRVNAVDTLDVRVDNTPNYQLLRGKLQRLRLASRGVEFTPDLRLKTFALETDLIAVDFETFREGNFSSFSQLQNALKQPLNAAFQLTFTEKDLNRFFATAEVKTQLNAIAQRVAQQLPSTRNQRYKLLSTTVNFTENNRLIVDLKLRVSRRQGERFQDFDLRVASGIKVQQGKELIFVAPRITVDGKPLPPRLVPIIEQRIRDRVNLGRLREEKIIARLLQLEIEEDEVKLAAFVQIASGARDD
ncbi:hypothetical protein PCC7418_2925 [Halothece sp. PCC 7418]|uniref:LmeA family phospholipid-binding protein n=1 Tax=Halothece sp. (strain PCC 7418) TaxID=65093 RepID=UPI0002A06C7E|nr:DUF2993 domain-containing protein [Halothece sp. PCC 7418]AFZ45054.1 hypothetical protein PCC7418_2925 [Halothece sp. PCC 7418]